MEQIRKYFTLTEHQEQQFAALGALYADWNSKINVISRKDIDNLYLHHVLHSMAIAKAVRFADGTRIADIGTGGGFPGIPLAILFPQCRFTLIDSIGKKVRVAGEVAAALGLTNVTTVNARAESLPDCYDFVVSRAVTTLDNFYPWVKDRFRYSIFYLKGGDVNEEIMQLMARQHLKKGSVHTWKVDNWLSDEYFQEKFVIQIEKDYLCSPIVGKI